VLVTAGAAISALSVRSATPAGAGPAILPRSAWADGLAPGPVVDEPDVRFLLVHHTVDTNDYPADAVVGLLRRIHGFHTGPERAWPDIAYNFIVDRFGRVWETRAGSIDRPVAGDATGGSQGFDQKCAFLGDHRTEAPSPAAVDAMASLLAMLAERSGIDTRPGATTSFVSRGSNLHPTGATVTTPTIAGHRTMSRTACPGDAGSELVRDRLPALVSARRPAPATVAPATTAAPTTSVGDTAAATTTATTTSTSATSTSPSSTATAADPAASASPAPTGGVASSAAARGAEPDHKPWPVLGVAGGAVAAALGGLLLLRQRITGGPPGRHER
jgi:hypothetical protein